MRYPTTIHYSRRPRVMDSAEEQREERVLQEARDILMRRMGDTQDRGLNSPREVRDYLKLTLGAVQGHEEFWCIYLDARHRVIAAERLCVGTLTETSVYPREVVKAVLRQNAAAVILAHNHPSGIAEPSHADELLTRNLKAALKLVDTQLLDHFIVAGNQIMSFAERGLL